jgi:hypothetical protein
MSRKKAARPTDHKTHKPRARFSSVRSRSRQAISPDFTMQALSVTDGQRCIGHILSRGKAGVEAFDVLDRSLGLFPNQKAAADAVTKAVGGAA